MPDPAPGIAEIAALRERLARLEAIAVAQPPADLGTALHDHYATTSRSERDLQNAAYGWQPNDQMEQAIKARDRDPAAYAAAMAATHESGLPLSLYERGRAAALALNPDALKETK